MSLLGFCEWLEATPVALLVRESLWGFQILAAIHIMGLALSVGTLVWFDLRLLGVAMTRVRITEVYRRLMPWAGGGFLVMFTTGALLFAGSATDAYGNLAVRIKLSAIALAGVNALAYHLLTERQIAMLDYAVKVTLDPAGCDEEDITILREFSYEDGDIWDIAEVAAMFNFTNRLASATGMLPNPEYNGMAR